MNIKTYIIICLLLCGTYIHTLPITNPHWKRGAEYRKIGIINPYILARPQLITHASWQLDYVNGIYFGLYYNSDCELRLSRLFNFGVGLKVGETVPTLNTFNCSWNIYPFNYFKTTINYKMRDFSRYKIIEHNVSFVITGIFDFRPLPRWFQFEFLCGLNLKFIDYDITTHDSTYRNDWYLEIFNLFEIKFLFSPLPLYSFGISLGNYDGYAVYTANYWQVVIYNYIHLPKNFSIFMHGGFSLAGSFPFAANINRGWAELGVRYEITP